MPKGKPVVVVIGKETFTLEPTYEAQADFDLILGGLQTANEAVRRINVSQMATVVGIGAGIDDAEKVKDIARAIFASSTEEKGEIVRALGRFIGLMFNGGVEVSSKKSAGKATSAEGNE